MISPLWSLRHTPLSDVLCTFQVSNLLISSNFFSLKLLLPRYTFISLPLCFLSSFLSSVPPCFSPSLYLYLALVAFPPSFPASLRPGTVYTLPLFSSFLPLPTSSFFFFRSALLLWPILVPSRQNSLSLIGPYVDSMTLRSVDRRTIYGHGESPEDMAEPGGETCKLETWKILCYVSVQTDLCW